ncbi:PcfJ domain-containing protein [Blastopirellula marina]|uniref:PcfJ-like protein n=1 Tax=Blastopirellula marina TaxID=124 RepID=A0A2S8GJ47_9BACT|nr:PcfJ domain-containing protein [Blastopirellula marina]PQO44473.1 hypothetical protein C5Y93_18860 [Blastopirellula marina]
MSQQERTHHAKARLDALLGIYAPAQSHRQAYWDLIRIVRERSQILNRHLIANFRWDHRFVRFVEGLAAAVEHQDRWIRHPGTWPGSSSGLYGGMRSLMRHLFQRYPVPDFVSNSWFARFPEPWYRPLYLHMAEGRGIRQFADRPSIPLSPKAARHYLNAPADLDPIEAQRWAQIVALGGAKAMARKLVCYTVLGECSSDEPFWGSVLRFLVANSPLLHDEEVQIVDFINGQRFRPGHEAWGRGGGMEPLQPNFSMKGRTLRSMRRYMIHWREELLRKRPELAIQTSRWPHTEIAPMVHRQGGSKWMLFELVSDRALLLEGAAMRHCVKDYLDECVSGRSSIWSLRVNRGPKSERMATIEVSPKTKRIVQAQGKCNSSPTPEAWQVLENWAEREGLEFNWFVRR